jgi:hypothetical protein
VDLVPSHPKLRDFRAQGERRRALLNLLHEVESQMRRTAREIAKLTDDEGRLLCTYRDLAAVGDVSPQTVHNWVTKHRASR